MSMDLSFLINVELDTVVPKTKTKTAVPKLPVDSDIRVFANGRVYPSEAYAKEANLEFAKKEVDELSQVAYTVGNGLDIFDSLRWGMIAGKLPQELIFIAAVPKGAAKVDMWGSTSYDEKGDPKASVLTQGVNTFSKRQLVPMLEEIYNIDWATTAYVDLKVSRDNTITSPTGIYHLPKVVSGGKLKGTATYIRRENITINPLIIEHIETKEATKPEQLDIFAAADAAPDTFVPTIDKKVEGLSIDTDVVVQDAHRSDTDVSLEDQALDAVEETKDLGTEEKSDDPEDDWAANLGL